MEPYELIRQESIILDGVTQQPNEYYQFSIAVPPHTKNFIPGCCDLFEDFLRLIGDASEMSFTGNNSLVVIKSCERRCMRRAIVLQENFLKALSLRHNKVYVDNEIENRLLVANMEGFSLSFAVPKALEERTIGPKNYKIKNANKNDGISFILYRNDAIFIHAMTAGIASNAKKMLQQLIHTVYLAEYTLVRLVNSNLLDILARNKIDISIPGITEAFPVDVPETRGLVPLMFIGTQTHLDEALIVADFFINKIVHMYYMSSVSTVKIVINETNGTTDLSAKIVKIDIIPTIIHKFVCTETQPHIKALFALKMGPNTQVLKVSLSLFI